MRYSEDNGEVLDRRINNRIVSLLVSRQDPSSEKARILTCLQDAIKSTQSSRSAFVKAVVLARSWDRNEWKPPIGTPSLSETRLKVHYPKMRPHLHGRLPHKHELSMHILLGLRRIMATFPSLAACNTKKMLWDQSAARGLRSPDKATPTRHARCNCSASTFPTNSMQ